MANKIIYPFGGSQPDRGTQMEAWYTGIPNNDKEVAENQENISELQESVSSLTDSVSSITEGASENYDTFQEVEAFIEAAQAKDEEIESSIAETKENVESLSAKVETVTTELSNTIEEKVQEAVEKVTGEIPTKVSELENDSEFATKTEVEETVASKIAEVIDGADESFDTLKEVAEWIASDESKSADIVTSISKLQEELSGATSAHAQDVEAINTKFEDYSTTDEVETMVADAKAEVENGVATVDAKVETLSGEVEDAKTAIQLAISEAKEEVEQEIAGVVDNFNTHVEEANKELETKASIDYVDEKISGITSDFNAHVVEAQEALDKKAEITYVDETVEKAVADGIAKVVAEAPESLDTLKEIAEWIANDETNAAKMAEDIEALNAFSGTSEEAFAEVSELVSNANTNIATLQTQVGQLNETVVELALQADVDDAVAELETSIANVGLSVSELSGVVSAKADASELENYQPKGEYLTEHQSLDEYSKTTDIEAMVAEVEVEIAKIGADYTTSGNVETMVAEGIAKVVAEAPEDFDTLKEVANWIANDTTGAAAMQNAISTLQDAKTSNDVVIADIEASIADVADDVAELSGAVATKAEKADVESAIANAKAEVEAEIPSVDGLASEAYVTELLASYAKAEDIPSVEEFTTSGEVESMIESAKTEVEAKIPTLVSQLTNDKAYAQVKYVDEKANLMWSAHNADFVQLDNTISTYFDSLSTVVGSLSKSLSQTQVEDATTVTDANAKVNLVGDIEAEDTTMSLTASELTLSNNVVTSTRLSISANTVTVIGATFEDGVKKSVGNANIAINNAETVIFKDMTFNSDECYNGVEIDLNSNVAPKKVLFDNCKFLGRFENNAISIFATQDNAEVTIQNCHFENVSNVLRMSNKNNGSGITVNILNCTVDAWENGTYKPANAIYAGFFCFEDYTNTASSEAAYEANLFGDGKITVNINGLTGPSGIVRNPENIADVMGTSDPATQIGYVSYDAGPAIMEYDATYYPTFKFMD